MAPISPLRLLINPLGSQVSGQLRRPMSVRTEPPDLKPSLTGTWIQQPKGFYTRKEII
jgi:hypothetical protein